MAFIAIILQIRSTVRGRVAANRIAATIPLCAGHGGLDSGRAVGPNPHNHFSTIGAKQGLELYKRRTYTKKMSAIKTHDHWQVVQGGTIHYTGEEEEDRQPLEVRAIRVSRNNPSACLLLTEKTYEGGSIPRTEQNVLHAHITGTVPSANTTEFNVSTRLDGQTHALNLTSVKSSKESCVVM